jgi:predicted helicase
MTQKTAFDALFDSLPSKTTTQRGDAFELVSDWALMHSSDFGHEIASIERFPDWAKRVGRIKDRDLGVDAIVTTVDGELWAVQNKGYAATNIVSYSDFSNFVLASKALPDIKRLILVTSGPGITGNASKINRDAGTNVIVLNRNWLADACEYPSDFSALVRAVRSDIELRQPYTLRDDQEKAVHNVVKALRTNQETQVWAACGTGKTVLSEALARALGAKLIIFLVPSLGLMRQSRASWQRQTGLTGMKAIAVCSDDTVGRPADDSMAWSDEELGCEVLRDSEKIATWIKENSTPFQAKPVVVFTTYHSVDLIVAAQHKHGAPDFDFAFADEAHFLVGTTKHGARIGELVKRKDDKRRRLRARYRVYATATPRMLSQKASAKLKDSGAQPLDSMDHDSAVFGPVAHILTFGEAITLGVLANYQVMVVAVPEKKYADYVNNRAYIETTNDYILDAQTFAAVEALKLAAEMGITKVISYHNWVADAQLFKKLVDAEPKLPAADTIWGELPAAQRESRIARIDRPEGHVLTNVRCLNEGVDIPSLDAVLFAGNKTSPVDIAQSVGRALRKAPGKEKGYIIIPVAVSAADWETGTLSAEERESLTSGPSPYRPVFDVLNALSSHDETIRHILTALRLGLGKKKNAKGIDRDELPDTPEDMHEYLDGIVGPDGEIPKGLRVPAGATSLLGDGKIVLHAAGMTDAMREQFAASMRLAIVRDSSKSNLTQWEHVMNVLVYGNGYTWAEADQMVKDAQTAVVRNADAA